MVKFPDDGRHHRDRHDGQRGHEKPQRIFPLESDDFSCFFQLFRCRICFFPFIKPVQDDVTEEVKEHEARHRPDGCGGEGGAKRQPRRKTYRWREKRLHY